MKKIFFYFFSFTLLFSFSVEFTKVYSEYAVPDKKTVAVCTESTDLTFPFEYIKKGNCYILLGDTSKINMWLDNEFYAPEDAVFKDIKIKKIDQDLFQYKIIEKIKKTYKKCKIKNVVFLTPDKTRIITQPKKITTKYKIKLECN